MIWSFNLACRKSFMLTLVVGFTVLVKQSMDKTLGSVDREVMKFGSPLSTSCAAHVKACLISDEISSVQDFTMDSISHGTLDSVSASPFALPGRYFIVKLKSASSLIQRKPEALSFADDSTYVNGLLSVYTTNDDA